MAMASQQAACVRLVVDALLEGRFSKASVVAHMYEALQALIHDPQVSTPCLGGLRLLKHLPVTLAQSSIYKQNARTQPPKRKFMSLCCCCGPYRCCSCCCCSLLCGCSTSARVGVC
jgi:hypothetical protein